VHWLHSVDSADNDFPGITTDSESEYSLDVDEAVYTVSGRAAIGFIHRPKPAETLVFTSVY